MATKKKTPRKATGTPTPAGKATSPSSEAANRAAKAEFEAYRERAAAVPATASPTPAAAGASPHGRASAHPYANPGPYPGGHPMFGWSAPWGPPPGMPAPVDSMAGVPYPGAASAASGGSLLENVGTLLRLGVDLLNAGLQGGTQLMCGMGGLQGHGHPWPIGHGGHREPHGDGHGFWHQGSCAHSTECCCCAACTSYVDCCCCYGHHDCHPGVHNCP